MIPFNKTTPEKAAVIVLKLENRLTEYREDYEKARENYGSASLAVEEGTPNADSAKDKTLKELQKLQNKIAETEATLAAAKVRHADALKIQAEEQENDRWTQVKVIADERDKLAQQIELDAKQLVTNFDKLLKLGVEQYNVAPRKDVTLNASSLSAQEISVSLRQYLFKQSENFRWTHRWPWGATTIPDFTERVSEGNNWLLAQKERFRTKSDANRQPQEISAADDIFS